MWKQSQKEVIEGTQNYVTDILGSDCSITFLYINKNIQGSKWASNPQAGNLIYLYLFINIVISYCEYNLMWIYSDPCSVHAFCLIVVFINDFSKPASVHKDYRSIDWLPTRFLSIIKLFKFYA